MAHTKFSENQILKNSKSHLSALKSHIRSKPPTSIMISIRSRLKLDSYSSTRLVFKIFRRHWRVVWSVRGHTPEAGKIDINKYLDWRRWAALRRVDVKNARRIEGPRKADATAKKILKAQRPDSRRTRTSKPATRRKKFWIKQLHMANTIFREFSRVGRDRSRFLDRLSKSCWRTRIF